MIGLVIILTFLFFKKNVLVTESMKFFSVLSSVDVRLLSVIIESEHCQI